MDTVTKDRTRVGFIGVGNMGAPMVRNLAKAGWKVTVYDTDPAKTAEFTAAKSLRELAQGCDVVITMLPDGHIVRRVALGRESGEDCLAAGFEKGALIIDMSSSAPVGTRELGADLAKRGIGLIDAPVSGGVKGAVAATMSIMVGGDPSVAQACDELLAAMGKRFYVGALGSGHAAKVLNNYVSAAGLAAAAEAVRVGASFGIDPHTLVSVINASTGRNNSTENKFEQFILNEKFNSGFALGLMAKDLTLAMEVADKCGVPAELGKATLAMWKHAEQQCGGAADHTEIARYVNERK
jgi:3-hydroxyisobutyrate dehydrogenase